MPISQVEAIKRCRDCAFRTKKGRCSSAVVIEAMHRAGRRWGGTGEPPITEVEECPVRKDEVRDDTTTHE